MHADLVSRVPWRPNTLVRLLVVAAVPATVLLTVLGGAGDPTTTPPTAPTSTLRSTRRHPMEDVSIGIRE